MLLRLASLALVGLLSLSCHRKPDDSACDRISTTLISPDGEFKAELTVSTCAWGFGMAAESAEVKVTRLGGKGYFFVVPIEWCLEDDEAGLAKPSIRWTAPRTLTIHAVSKEVTGTLIRNLSTPRLINNAKGDPGYQIKREGLQVIREYVQK